MRYALLVLLLVLAGCSDNSFGTFLGDTHNLDFGGNPNGPIANSETVRRVKAEPVTIAPLSAEPGNVWPGPPAPVPTLADIQKTTNPLPGPLSVPGVPPATVPGQTPALPTPGLPKGPPASPNLPPPMSKAPTPGTAVQTGNGTSSPSNGGTSGYQTLSGPNGGVLIPNGNGTSTLIRPDGSVTTVPTPK